MLCFITSDEIIQEATSAEVAEVIDITDDTVEEEQQQVTETVAGSKSISDHLDVEGDVGHRSKKRGRGGGQEEERKRRLKAIIAVHAVQEFESLFEVILLSL